MLFTSATVLGLLAAAANALPAASTTPNATIPADAKFGLIALRSASPIHFSPVQASKSSIFLQFPDQGAQCQGDPENSATFWLQDGGLYLYGGKGNTPQQLYADLSGMGQGVLGYTTGAQPITKYAQRGPWSLDAAGDLTLDGRGLIACPNAIEGAWGVWVDAGIATPGGKEGCLPFSARAVVDDTPNGCYYSEQ